MGARQQTDYKIEVSMRKRRIASAISIHSTPENVAIFDSSRSHWRAATVQPKARRCTLGDMDDASNCREQAGAARTIADKLKDPTDKAVWLKVADEWLDLAETAEARAQSTPSPQCQ